MALKANVTYGAKRSRDFNSDSFCVTLEAEITEPSKAQEEIATLFLRAKEAVAEQIRQANATPQTNVPQQAQQQTQQPQQTQQRPASKSERLASQAQVKAIYAIAKQQRLERQALTNILRDEFRQDRPESLTLAEASHLIERLKSRQAS